MIRNHFLSMNTKEISTIDVIGSNRAEQLTQVYVWFFC